MNTTRAMVFQRRLARSVAGGVGLTFALAMCPAAFFWPQASTALLIMAWPAMFIGWVLGRLLALWVEERELEFLGLFLPMSAIAMLAPLSIHLLVSFVAEAWPGGSQPDMDFMLKEFGSWIAISCAIVGHVHLCLVGAIGWSLKRLITAEPGAEAYDHNRHMGWSVLALTVLVSIIPGAVLMFIPCILTAVTGLLFIPWMFYIAHRVLFAERAELIQGALIQPELTIGPKGVVHRSALGQVNSITWSEPFRVVFHREPIEGEGKHELCHLHLRLVQENTYEHHTVALTLTLPWES
ncbi:MAG: hypothetical protein AAFS10_19605, partial [Myxococcota bacterium]